MKTRIALAAILAVLSIPAAAHGRGAARPAIKYLGNYPSNHSDRWTDGLQGVANDSRSWYFTQVGKLWKIPLSHSLRKSIKGVSGVRSARIPKALRPRWNGRAFSPGYNHMGDLDHHKGYLFVPLESSKGALPALIAVYRARDLRYVGSAPLNLRRKVRQGRGFRTVIDPMKKSGWFALHPTSGMLYTSHSEINEQKRVYGFRIDHAALARNEVIARHVSTVRLTDGRGRTHAIQGYMQGGVFSGDGKLLFLINGKAKGFKERNGGIRVFDFATKMLIRKSRTKNDDFKFEFHTGFPKYEEPEGITWLDASYGVPGVRGQLHAILLDNDRAPASGGLGSLGGALQDEIFFKHYRVR